MYLLKGSQVHASIWLCIFVSRHMLRNLKWVCLSVRRRNEGVLCECNSSYSFFFDLFETLLMFCSWSEDVHAVWTLQSKNFSTCELSHFSASQMQQVGTVLCECNSYNLSLIFLKLCRCFVHGLKMYMWFGHYLRIGNYIQAFS